MRSTVVVEEQDAFDNWFAQNNKITATDT
jgi:heme/copper-type cytochrome/quinol oxidase subunit 2